MRQIIMNGVDVNLANENGDLPIVLAANKGKKIFSVYLDVKQ